MNGETAQIVELHDVVQLMEMEYAELPELQLTFCQAQHLLNLSNELCERALTELVGSGFLTRTPAGTYIRNAA